MIAVVDYGLGNLKSVHKAFKLLNIDSVITNNPDKIMDANSIVFPGVGSFGDCMKELDRRKLIKPITDSIKSGKFFLGICLGLQILFSESEESPEVPGLGIFEGSIDKINFDKKLKIPHMGWNKIFIEKKSEFLQGINNESWMYFVHSFKFKIDQTLTLTKSEYGQEFSSSINKENIFATQFHPEKSSSIGLKVLDNFSKLSN